MRLQDAVNLSGGHLPGVPREVLEAAVRAMGSHLRAEALRRLREGEPIDNSRIEEEAYRMAQNQAYENAGRTGGGL